MRLASANLSLMDALPFYVELTDPPSKQELLKAALKLFARDGVRESSIRAVAEEAGFTNTVLFKYFEGKDALALHLFERCYLRLVREMMGALSGGGSFRVRLGRVIARLLALLDESPEAVLFVNEELRRYWPRVSKATRAHSLVGMTRTFFEESEVSKEIDRTLLVAGFWGLLGQFARMHAFGEWKGPAVAAAPQLEALVFKMLKG
jgi:TetR/AcrR family transcriptional regulator, repressor of fatR-cypB operon